MVMRLCCNHLFALGMLHSQAALGSLKGFMAPWPLKWNLALLSGDISGSAYIPLIAVLLCAICHVQRQSQNDVIYIESYTESNSMASSFYGKPLNGNEPEVVVRSHD